MCLCVCVCVCSSVCACVSEWPCMKCEGGPVHVLVGEWGNKNISYLQHFSVVPQTVNKVVSMVVNLNLREKLDKLCQLDLTVRWLLTT